MNPRYAQVAATARHRCEYCHAPEVVFNFPFEVEHIIPPVLGGVDSADNLALACRACNVRKGVHLEHIDPTTQSSERLYHPRQDEWEEHFSVDGATCISPLRGRIEHICLRSVANTIEGGTSEIQRTIIATRDMGLPRS
jgi:hypothetical protein